MNRDLDVGFWLALRLTLVDGKKAVMHVARSHPQHVTATLARVEQ